MNVEPNVIEDHFRDIFENYNYLAYEKYDSFNKDTIDPYIIA